MPYPSRQERETAILEALREKPAGAAKWRQLVEELGRHFQLTNEEIAAKSRSEDPLTRWQHLCRQARYQLVKEGKISSRGGIWALKALPVLKILLINGPSLNVLGKRDPSVYGTMTLRQIEDRVKARAKELRVEVQAFQSNSEGAIVDFLQLEGPRAWGVIINPGALTHYGLSLREALVDTGVPVVEVHLSNIHAREWWRRRSVVADVARAQVSGLGWRGYLAALDYLATEVLAKTGRRQRRVK